MARKKSMSTLLNQAARAAAAEAKKQQKARIAEAKRQERARIAEAKRLERERIAKEKKLHSIIMFHILINFHFTHTHITNI